MFSKILKAIIPAIGVILAWIVFVPIFEFPDEQVHLSTVSYFADHGSIQPYNTPDVTAEMYRTQELLGTLRDGLGNNRYTYHPEYHVQYSDSTMGIYERDILSLNNTASRSAYIKDEGAQYPPLYYAYSSLWLRLVSSSDLIMRTFVVRLGSLPLVALSAYFIYQIGILIFSSHRSALALLAITILQPMYSFVSAGINSDNLHNTLFIILIYYCLRLIQSGIALLPLLGAASAIVLDIYTKPQGFIGLGILGLALLFAALRHRQWRLLLLSAVLGIIVLIVTYPQLSRYLAFALLDNSRGLSLLAYLQFSLNKLLAQNVVWYWGVFKWLGVVLPPLYWRLANRLVLLSAVGFLIYLARVIFKKKLVANFSYIIFILLVSFIYAFAIFWADWQHHKNVGYSLGIQARYFFPTLVCHLALLQTGILSFSWNNLSRRILRALLVLFFVWLQLGALWHLLSIYYNISSLNTLITQISQYKPYFAKGSWIYLWAIVYVSSLLAIAYTNFKKSPPIHNSTRASSGK